MYSEFNQVFLLGMSNSELFLVKGDQEGVEFDILKRPSTTSTEFHDESGITAAANDDRELRQEPADEQVKEDKCRKVIGLGESSATAHEDDDGFRTPTSTDHKIPEIKQCPPAPRKSKSTNNPSAKRKSSSVSSNIRRSLRLDVSEEVNSLFPKPILDDLHRKIKRARTEDQEN
ncbi:cyclin-dependent protein kinase inhibitor SMR3 [Melia azedarach]|uniref:Cyclin-dependent protein kinase inhibitor SMR3 n=1 Tax=Melia azedarach TaxID=155640 RepID=A0ACC1WZN7_MELAZ|nr:cyclin-dependent protein kinase inhibitor SMR3 [Melia azedarach]